MDVAPNPLLLILGDLTGEILPCFCKRHGDVVSTVVGACVGGVVADANLVVF